MFTQLLHKDHPVWPILRILAITFSVSLILMFNASDFDATEVKTIAELFGANIIIEALKRKVTKT